MTILWVIAALLQASPGAAPSPAPGQGPTRSIGRYLTVWKRDGAGNWRIIRNLSLGD